MTDFAQAVFTDRFAPPSVAYDVAHMAAPSSNLYKYLDDRSHGQRSLVDEFWKARHLKRPADVRLLFRGRARDLFDPDKTHIALNFVAAGGMDAILSFLDARIDSTFGGCTTAVAVDTLRSVIRLLTELIVIQNSLAWYIVQHDGGRVIARVCYMAEAPQIAEDALSLLEHVLAAVGPIIELRSCPPLLKVLHKGERHVVAGVCRVVALLLVSGCEQSRPPAAEDRFPVCLTRMVRMEEVIASNIETVLSTPEIGERLISLAETRPAGLRLMNENRQFSTMPVGGVPLTSGSGSPPPASGPASMGGAASAASSWQASLASILQQLGLSHASVVGHALPQSAAHEDDDDHDDDDDDDGDDDDSMTPNEFSVAGLSNEAGLIAAAMGGAINLNGLSGGVGGDGGQAAVQPAQPDMQWFTGGVRHYDVWRFDKQVLVDTATSDFPLTLELISKMPSPISRDQYAADQCVFNAQSEVLFVLNTLLNSQRFRQAWSLFKRSSILPRLVPVFELVFEPPPVSSASAPPAAATQQLSGPTDVPLRREENASDSDSDSDDDDDDAGHSHDPMTLRKIEYLRLVHEYWDAREAEECIRLNRDEGDQQARDDICKRMVHQLTVKNDVCVQNLLCYSLEAFLRGHWLTSRPRAQKQLQPVISTVLGFVFRPAAAQPLGCSSIVLRRELESSLTLLAELCKFNCANCRIVDQYLSEVPARLEALRQFFVKRPFQTNFFLRAIVLTACPKFRFSAALGVLSTDLSAAVPPSTVADDENAMRAMEQPSLLLARVDHVKQLVRRWFLDGQRGALSIPSSSVIVDALADAPAIVARSERVPWFADGTTCDPIPPNSKAALHQPHVLDAVMAAAADPAAAMPNILATFTKMKDEIVHVYMSHLDFNAVESTEKLCEVTTLLVIFLHEYASRGAGGVEELIMQACTLHTTNSKVRDRAPATVLCPARNFFGLLCMWTAHYVCQQRYFHTLFFCTQVDCCWWRDIVLLLLDRLPWFFGELAHVNTPDPFQSIPVGV